MCTIKYILTFYYSLLYYSLCAYRSLILEAHLQLHSCSLLPPCCIHWSIHWSSTLFSSMSVCWRAYPHSFFWSSKLERLGHFFFFYIAIVSEWFLYFSILRLFHRDHYLVWFLFLELLLAQTVSWNQTF